MMPREKSCFCAKKSIVKVQLRTRVDDQKLRAWVSKNWEQERREAHQPSDKGWVREMDKTVGWEKGLRDIQERAESLFFGIKHIFLSTIFYFKQQSYLIYQ